MATKYCIKDQKNWQKPLFLRQKWENVKDAYLIRNF